MAKSKHFIKEIVGEIPEKVDIIIGLPSLNEELTIKHVAEVVAKACHDYFPQYNCFIVNVDSNSEDNTVREFLSSNFYGVQHAAVICDPNKRGKGYNIRNLIYLARKTQAKVCVMVDSDLKSIKEDWIRKLVQPILLENYDLVVPYYVRHKFDGTITNNIVYPFIKGFFGVGIRQPIGGEFSLSGRLVEKLDEVNWFDTVYKFGIDIFIVGTAILFDFDICSVFLGKKEHKPKDPGKDLEDMFVQVTYTLFKLIKENIMHIKDKKISYDVPLLFREDANFEVEPIEVDFNNLLKRFKEGFKNYKYLYLRILGQELYNKLEVMVTNNSIQLEDEMWADLIYRSLIYFLDKESFEEEMEVVKSLIPLYFARVYFIFKEVEHLPEPLAEKRITLLATQFERRKSYLF